MHFRSMTLYPWSIYNWTTLNRSESFLSEQGLQMFRCWLMNCSAYYFVSLNVSYINSCAGYWCFISCSSIYQPHVHNSITSGHVIDYSLKAQNTSQNDTICSSTLISPTVSSLEEIKANSVSLHLTFLIITRSRWHNYEIPFP